MSKRKIHTLDSDEEDEVKDTGVLHLDDIEGQEDGMSRQEEGHRMTAFNMKEEMGEGHFDKNGHFIWKNEEEIRDNWLDNVDWHKIKNDPSSQYNLIENAVGLGEDSDSSDEAFDETKNYQEMLNFMKPGETVNKALNRLGGKNKKLSSVERLKRKKAGTLVENQDVIKLTALANDNLTAMGNMNIYQETYESISKKIFKKKTTEHCTIDHNNKDNNFS
ncbi:CD2 antigen cytoplasmic tail-binding protein 2 homolog isoform X2 [Coccinella septempunctata]|uniref:CD2 antigen cytoplasmic tail-binding protein 2 homolog isoform X2 n=1 Tax=Coccinella septempunctata TaxID=41139 RepID=UPI001D0605DD|nr:CD2 antigen cytoplasmic tail-binding protein 2 homolog isoform X2 [Coccinella septempunctata]